ncbi:MAG: biotin carboxylase N-terminal domain-containing protein [Pseudomonadota bacterium]
MPVNPIRSVLVANRGEIACRVMRTAESRGIRTIAVYSDADENAMHVRYADEAVRIGPAASTESYLKIDAIIDACKATGADAVHPGYGFLSENAAFAEALAKENITFIGPSSGAISAMGDKAESKRRMIDAGVPTIPGYQDEDQSDATLIAAAAEIGFPVMVKASAGGGGRGQRIVTEADELEEALASARREASSSFGDDRLIIEKAVVGARHVEIQVMGDTHGNIIHFGERDCSLQRRRQKVIEEAPSPVITPELRNEMGAAAVAAAKSVDYVGAGTVEFLFDPSTKEFHFLEMNTRLQVEHPVTEEVMDVDLVGLQFDVAEGRKLEIRQEDVMPIGWAIEARLYAEDPSQAFMPQTGELLEFFDATSGSIRIDAGVEAGDRVTSHYDPMIAKVIASCDTRDSAREVLADFLDRLVLLGLKTNAEFLANLLRDETFAAGEADTTYIERHLDALAAASKPLAPFEAALVAAANLERSHGPLLSGWNSRGSSSFPMHLKLGDDVSKAIIRLEKNGVTATIGDVSSEVMLLPTSDDNRDPMDVDIRYVHEGVTKSAFVIVDGDTTHLKTGSRTIAVTDTTFAPAEAGGAAGDDVRAPMAGVIVSVDAAKGDAVSKGQTLIVIEAMKMEHRLAAPRDGVIESIGVSPGDQVSNRAIVASLVSDTPAAKE